MSGSTPSPEEQAANSGKDTLSLAARRARLRGTLARRGIPETAELLAQAATEAGASVQATPSDVLANNQEAGSTADIQGGGSSLPYAKAPVPTGDTLTAAEATSTGADALETNTSTGAKETSNTTADAQKTSAAADIVTASTSPAPSSPIQSLTTAASAPQVTLRARPSFGISMSADITRSGAAEMLKNIDQAMSTCAANLANLQKVASEQADALKELTTTLQDKSLHDAEINLSTLTESFSAALEPMKEVGRLVPTIAQLNTTVNEHMLRDDKVTPDDLIANLAQQLTDGAIDSETFKSAYKAIFPDKNPTDLLRGLVELLGTQRLSGGLFRAAYDAVQASEPLADGTTQLVNNQEMLSEFEELTRANKELQEALTKREEELEEMLSGKDLELQNVQAQMAIRYEEFDSRYAKLSDKLSSREQEYDTLLKNKDMEIAKCESELAMLRRQMEELRSQTQELVSGLQKQATTKTVEPSSTTKPQTTGSFFDTAERPQSFYADDSIAIPATQGALQTSATTAAAATAPASVPVTPRTTTATATPAAPATPGATTAIAGLPSSVPRPTPGAGRHGTGVRAQVFEVIVRQALAGAPWREMCAGPMQVNSITTQEVEAEVKRRQENAN